MEHAFSVKTPAATGRGPVASDVAVASAGDDHLHEWRRVPDAVGLFCCIDAGCQWFAVCPVCLRSLDVALRVRDGLTGMALYWCPAHQGEMEG